MNFRFSNLENIKTIELIDVFNASFADYFVKIALDKETLSGKILTENIVLQNSVGTFFANKLIGFILFGIENGVAYNAGTGVLPEFRGNSLTKQMYDFILPKLKVQGIFFHQLEVVTQNIPAIKTYEKIGFKRVRTLGCFKGKINISKINQKIELRFLEDIDQHIFPTFLHSQPSWQNSLSAIKRTKHQHKILGAFYQNNLVGYLIYTETRRIKLFAVKQDFRHSGIGHTLFSKLNGKEINITNIDQDNAETISFLKKIGLNLFLEQFEMKLII